MTSELGWFGVGLFVVGDEIVLLFSWECDWIGGSQ